MSSSFYNYIHDLSLGHDEHINHANEWDVSVLKDKILEFALLRYKSYSFSGNNRNTSDMLIEYFSKSGFVVESSSTIVDSGRDYGKERISITISW